MSFLWLLTFGALYLFAFYCGVRWAWSSPPTTRTHILRRAVVLGFFLSPALLVGGEGFAVMPYSVLLFGWAAQVIYNAFTASPQMHIKETLLLLGWNTVAAFMVAALLYSIFGVRYFRRLHFLFPWVVVALAAGCWAASSAISNWYTNGVLCEPTDLACYAEKAATLLDRSICDRVSGPGADRVRKGCLLAYAAYSNDLSVCSAEGVRAPDRPEMYQCVLYSARASGDIGLCTKKLQGTWSRASCEDSFLSSGPLKSQELY